MASKQAIARSLTKASTTSGSSALQSFVGRTPTPTLRRGILTLLNQRLTRREGPAAALTLSPEQQAPLFWTSGQPAGIPDQLAITGGVQSGKTTVLSLDITTRVPWLGPTPIFLVGPDFAQTRHERTALERYLGALGWVDWSSSVLPKAENEPWVLRTKFGSEIRGLSGQKPETLAGESPSYIGLAEAGQAYHEVHKVLRARATARGARYVLAGTLEKSQAWFRRLTRVWKGPNSAGARCFELPSWANPLFYPGGRWDVKILAAERDLDPETFLQRHAGKEPPVEGLVFGEFSPEVHGVTVRWGARPPEADPWELWLPPEHPVEIAIDPGYLGSAYAVLALTRFGGHIVVFDEVYVRGMVHQQVIAACQRRPWWPNVVGGVIDIAGTQHAMGGEPGWDVWASPVHAGGAALKLDFNKVPLWQGTDRLHLALRVDPLTDLPQVIVDTDACPRLVWELTEGYRYKTGTDGEILGEEPHNRANDAVKALSYWLYDRLGPLGDDTRAVTYGNRPRARLPWESESA